LALYQPKPIFPQTGEIVDPIISLTFKWQIQGSSSCVAYQMTIYDICNNVIYSGEKVSLATPLYNGETLEIIINEHETNCVVGTTYKHAITVWYDATHNVSSGEILFYARTTPTLSINIPTVEPHTLQYFTFTLNYVQAESVAIKNYEYTLYDSAMLVIDIYKQVGTSKTEYYVDGLISGNTYYIQATVINQENVSVTSDLETFSVEYNIADFVSTPTVINNKTKNTIDLSWEVSQITGVLNSANGCYYVPSFIYAENTGVFIKENENITFTIDSLDDSFTAHYVFNIASSYIGNILTVIDNSKTYSLSYDGINFIYNMNGTISTTDVSSYLGEYWHVVLQTTQAIYINLELAELYPSDTLYPSDILYPVSISEP
jgi:hypothetical protein